ncbi:MAG TPA: PSD1 and planctomycete cytochrome C domain-containing protein [Planctomycetota bacterium]|nr:PSD1 and planctomycete cytochrome C domain-containing protein [Planctomycetota bacterium]
MRLFATVVLSLFALLARGAETLNVPAKVDFVKHIQPIFQTACNKCHGAEKQKGELRLDSKKLAMQGGSSGKSILPGNSKDSLLMHRILGKGDESRMPEKADPLTPAQTALIAAWIDQGAEWPDSASVAEAKIAKHWSYIKPARPAAPPLKNAAWVKNPIDAFVLARLEKENLKPAPEAPKETLLRRATIDLIGLPPSVAEVDAFLADSSPDAYEKAVDRLLASPQFGERWARPWLDLARYADTNGYEKDNRRQIWMFRDWVINAFNRDLPFDQFTIEQIAGDMLPGATDDQKVATGFHRNTMTNEEGGVDPAEARYEVIVDRVSTTATVWLGTTLACSQCHNHKYDPFPQKDFYALYAFWENCDEPQLKKPTPEQETRRKELEKQIAELQESLKKESPELNAAQAEWEKTAGAVSWSVLEPDAIKSDFGATLKSEPGGIVQASGENPAKDTYVIVARTKVNPIKGLRLEVLDNNGQGVGRAPNNGNFVLSRIALKNNDGNKPEQIALQKPVADFAQQDWPVSATIDTKPETGWAVAPEQTKSHTAVWEVAKPINHTGETTLTITLEQQSPHAQHNIARFRLSVTPDSNPSLQTIPENIKQLLAIAADKRDAAQKKTIGDYFRSISPLQKQTTDKIAALKKQLDTMNVPTTLVMQERKNSARPTADLRIRGNFLNKGEKVPAGTPGVLNKLPENEPVNRLALAKWLVSTENPLVARVTVNRFWEQIFGRGIVETAEDFGSQGERPTHPELLDWLACEFMQPTVAPNKTPWSMKSLLRTIVTSATYRQSSRTTRELLEKDPYNKLLAHAPRFRMEAEMIRDCTLAISGQLSLKMLGPSVFPYQPDGIWNIPYNGDRWSLSNGEDRYRRGLYTFWRRTSPYPSMVSFDAPSREFCTVRRVRTNTPMQALTTLNDPAYFDAAKNLAQRLKKEGGADEKAKLTFGFKLCTARAPKATELEKLLALYTQQAQKLKADAAGAKAITKGMSVPEAELPELAALTVVANVLLNLDETLTKE